DPAADVPLHLWPPDCAADAVAPAVRAFSDSPESPPSGRRGQKIHHRHAQSCDLSPTVGCCPASLRSRTKACERRFRAYRLAIVSRLATRRGCQKPENVVRSEERRV